jgi:imidazolonepropionase-like amidohydrolase
VIDRAALIAVTASMLIAAADADDLPADLPVVRHDDAVLSPGLIDVASSIGVYGGDSERTTPVDPSISAIDAYDADAPHVRRALEAGITAAMIAPQPVNLVCGATALVRTGGPREHIIVNDDGALLLALGPATWRPAGEPSSRAGAMFMLREVLTAAADGGGHPRLVEMVDGGRGAVVVCPQMQDVSAALRALGTRDVVPVVVHQRDATDVAEELAEYEAAAIVGPYVPSAARRVLRGAAALEAAGVAFAFSSGAPAADPTSLRLTAALAVRHGASPAAARRAMTSTAAEIAGAGDRIGELRPGLAADLVLFSDDPLRLDARVLEVYVSGVRAHAAAPSTHPPSPEGGR